MAYFNCIVRNTSEEISNIFGKWNTISDIKTQRQWNSCTPDGISFYIYDYKENRRIGENDTCDYHIGTRTKEDSINVMNWLNSIGLHALEKNYFFNFIT